MSTTTERKHWAVEYCNVYEGMPDSEGFNEELADKQIQGLMDIVDILANRMAQQEELILKMGSTIKKLSGVEDEETEYTPIKPIGINESIYL